MAALWTADPQLAQQLEEQLEHEPYAIEASRSGAPTVALLTADGRKIHLHSRYEPLEEARKLIDRAQTDQKAVFCVHGFGLGYHVENLFERASTEAMILVLESDLRLLRTAFEHRDFSKLISSGRVMFITQDDRGRLLLRLNAYQAMISAGLEFVVHAPSLQLQDEFHRRMQTVMSEFVAYCRTSLNTVILNGQRTAENIARNIGWYVGTGSLSRLAGRHAKQPAIIVSAGPSLRKNRHLLTEAAGRSVIIAVQTTLAPLLEMGIEPDYVTSLDYHDICTRFFERLPSSLKTELIAEPKASSAVLKLYPGPMTILGNDFAEKLVREMKLTKPSLRAGATVAHLAFYLAEHMGCDPIIFVGQDLAFSDGLCYTPGTSYEDVWRPELGRFCTMEMRQWEHIVRERPILRKIEDWQGRAIYTEERLFAYLQQFERDFAVSGARIIDATEGGAKKRGAEAMSLREALDAFCRRPLERAARGEKSALCVDRFGECIESLSRRRDEARKIAQIGRETAELLKEVSGCLEAPEKANRVIAKIDAVKARMHELNDCYEAITQLTQHTELVRFQSDRAIAASRVSGVEKQRRQLARDIVNVQGIIAAAERFEALMEEVMAGMRQWQDRVKDGEVRA